MNRPDRIAELTHRALTIAHAERGPVQINIPRDYFYSEFDATIPVVQPVEPSAGGAASLDEAARLLAEARFPVIVAGGGVVAGGAAAELLALAEFLDAPVATSYLHNDAFPSSHPLFVGPLGYQGSKGPMRLVAQADVVLALGTRLGPFGTLPQYGIEYWPKAARVIQVEADPRRIGLTRPVAVGIHGDARLAAAALLDRLERGGAETAALAGRDRRLAEIRAQQQAWSAELDSLSAADCAPVSPRRALRELERALPADAIGSTDIGNICSLANSYLRFQRAPSFLAAMTFGNCGYAYPVAVGAKVAAPERPAIAYVGDGAWGMSLAEVLTAVREGIPAIAVVFNNSQWGAEKRNQIDYYANRFPGTDLRNPSFAGIARAMGAEGATPGHPDEIGDALRTLIASGRPGVLEIMTTQELGEPFRRDALKKPKRLLPKYAAYTVD